MFLKCNKSIVYFLLIAGLFIGFGCSSSGDGTDVTDNSQNINPTSGSTPEEVINFDMVITGGRVIDSETARDEVASVGIKDGIIRKIISGNSALVCGEGCTKIDASGLIVSPGFINTHTHEGSGTGKNMVFASSKAFVQDGITFWLGGNCGLSATGVEMKFGDIIINNKMGLTLPEYFVIVDEGGLYSNYGTLSGNITLRGDAGIEHQQEETDAQIDDMVKMLEKDMALGTFGVSFGPFYDPGTTKKAMTALAKESKKLGGMSAIHMRMPTFNTWNVLNPWAPVEGSSNGPNMILFGNSVTEALDVCKESSAPMIISHLTDVSLNGSCAWVLDKIDKAISEDGLPVVADIIGFNTFSNDLLALTQFGTIPPGVLMTLGGIKPDQLWPAENVYQNDNDEDDSNDVVFWPAYKRLSSVKDAESLVDGFANKTLKVGKESTSMSLRVWCDIVAPDATKLALTKPFVFMGNDGGISTDNANKVINEPRTYACFSRLIGHWSRDEKAIELKQALFKSTIAPARWLGLTKKGRLQEGCDADIVIFDQNKIIDRARAEDGMLELKPLGFSKVIVNGQIVVDGGELTGKTPGRLIRRTWKIPGNTKDVIALYNKLFSN